MEIGSTPHGIEPTWPKVELSSLYLKAWMETRTALLWAQPAFADVWFRMMADRDKKLAWFTDKIPAPAGTDGQFMFINPLQFFRYTLKGRVFISCHEIAHCIFDHCGAGYRLKIAGRVPYPDGLVLPYNHGIMNRSNDCIINDMLIHGKVGEMPLDKDGQPEGWHMPRLITYMDDMFTAYRKLFAQMFGPDKKGVENYSRSNKALLPGPKGFDVHLEPGTGQGKPTQQAQEERNPQAWDNALAAALKSAKLAGTLSEVLDRGLSKLLEPQINWREQFTFAVSKQIGNDNSTWSILDNELMLRGIGAPGRTKYGCELVVCVADTSGSINQKTMDMFMGECAGVIEQARPARMILIQCDDKITEWVEIDDPADLVRKIKGGGGTDFRPPFKRLAEEGLEPDCLIYLTDLEGTFPSVPPSYPVVWATINKKKAPFGETIEIPKQINE